MYLKHFLSITLDCDFLDKQIYKFRDIIEFHYALILCEICTEILKAVVDDSKHYKLIKECKNNGHILIQSTKLSEQATLVIFDDLQCLEKTLLLDESKNVDFLH